MACLRVNDIRSIWIRRGCLTCTAKPLSCGLRLWQSCSNWGAGTENWLRSSI